ncbi:MAG: hypothetical protein ACI8TX_003744 [Hyphomicrobiaceae bacterium]|jgi:hypothetical protein
MRITSSIMARRLVLDIFLFVAGGILFAQMTGSHALRGLF